MQSYQKISDWLREQVQEGVYAADSQIPSESQLTASTSAAFQCGARFRPWKMRGVIYQRQGLVRLTDFIEDMAQAGLKASSTVLHFGQKKARRIPAYSINPNVCLSPPGVAPSG